MNCKPTCIAIAVMAVIGSGLGAWRYVCGGNDFTHASPKPTPSRPTAGSINDTVIHRGWQTCAGAGAIPSTLAISLWMRRHLNVKNWYSPSKGQP